jgi:L-fuconolactonase
MISSDDQPMFSPVREDWLARRQEAAILPELAIVDAHHHFSDRAAANYMLDELLADMAIGHRITATVFVEGRMGDFGGDELTRGVAETGIAAALSELARVRGIDGVAAAIVGNVDLTLGARVELALQAHVAAAAGRFRGIRQIAPWDPSPRLNTPGLDIDPDLLARPDFREGFARLAPLGLGFDAWLYYPQYGALRALAEAFPETRIILDFPVPLGIGGYRRDDAETMQRWREAVVALAACPNVAVKLGGFGMGACGFRFIDLAVPPSSAQLAEAVRPWFAEALQAFGTERCMIGSNFPVDKASFGYVVFWNACKILLGELCPGDIGAVLADNARRHYAIGVR